MNKNHQLIQVNDCLENVSREIKILHNHVRIKINLNVLYQ
jgi:hypothetical protein